MLLQLFALDLELIILVARPSNWSFSQESHLFTAKCPMEDCISDGPWWYLLVKRWGKNGGMAFFSLNILGQDGGMTIPRRVEYSSKKRDFQNLECMQFTRIEKHDLEKLVRVQTWIQKEADIWLMQSCMAGFPNF